MPLPDWPKFLEAVRSGSRRTVRQYLDSGADFRVTLDGLYNALEVAAFNGNEAALSAILEHRNFRLSSNNEKNYLLHRAIKASLVRDQIPAFKIITSCAKGIYSGILSLYNLYEGTNVEVIDIYLNSYDGYTLFGTLDQVSFAHRAIEMGCRDVLRYFCDSNGMEIDALIDSSPYSPLVVYCVYGDWEKVNECMIVNENWSWDNFMLAFRKTGLVGDVKLLSWLLDEVIKFESPAKIKGLVDETTRSAIARNSIEIVNWCLERERNDGTTYICWKKVTTQIDDKRKFSVCEMMKLIFRYKYNNRYDSSVNEPDLGEIFSRACFQNDAKTAEFILSNYRRHFDWQGNGHIACGHNNFDIVQMMVRHEMSFEKQISFQFAQTMFRGILDTLLLKNLKYWFVALPSLELILRHMVETGFNRLNPWSVYLSKKAWRNSGTRLDQHWNVAFANSQALCILFNKYFSIPARETFSYQLSVGVGLYPVLSAKILSLISCLEPKEFWSIRGSVNILNWLVQPSSTHTVNAMEIIPDDIDYCIRDFIICHSGRSISFALLDASIVSKLHTAQQEWKLVSSEARLQYYCDLFRCSGLQIRIFDDLMLQMPAVLPNLIQISNVLADFVRKPLSLSTICRVAVLKRLRGRRAPLISSIFALEPHLTKVALDQLLFDDFYEKEIPALF